MMQTSELTERLQALGDHLDEQRARWEPDYHPSTSPSTPPRTRGASLEPTSSGRTRPWVLAAAAVLVVVGVAGVVRLTITRPDDHPVAQQPADPPGPLYVLPNEMEAWTVSVIGNVQTSEIDPFRSVVVGERTDDGAYVDPVSITIDDAAPQGFDETWESVELATGTAYVKDEVSFIRFVQQRDGLWLWSFDVADEQTKLAAAFDELVITRDGTVDIAWGSPLSIIDQYNSGVQTTVFVATYEVADANHSVSILTSTASSPLGAGSADFADAISPVEIDGLTGWQVTRHIRGNTTSLAWMATPNRMVSVESSAPIDELLALAEDLQIVDEPTWTAATS